ncbi:MAG: MFS transporter [Calditrichia bacterium]|jgi:MFS family permease
MNSFLKSIGLNRAVLALSVARMADAMGNSILFIVIPLFVAKIPHVYFHMPLPVMVGVLLASYGLVNSIAQPFTGALSDRLGKRKILIISGLGVISLATLAFVFASSFLDLFLLRTLQGIGVAMTIPASMALMAVITQKETRGGSMGIYSTLRMAGFATGPLIGGYLKVHFGFNVTFYAGAGLLVIAMLMVYFWVKDVPVPEEAKSSRKFKIIDTSILDSGIVSAAIATFIMASSFSMVTTLENEFNARLQINAFDFSIAFSVLIIGRLLFQIPLGRLSDFIGRKPIIILGMILMAPATALLGESGSFYHFILLRIFQGIAAAGVAAPAFAVAGDLASTGGEGRQMSIITMGFGLGLAIGPLLAGLLAVVFFELPFLTVGFLSLVGAWVVYHYMPETVEGGKVLFSNHRR